jgi:hypothetical protein
MFKQICDGLAYCHWGKDENLKGDNRERPEWLGYLHRDLKPDNSTYILYGALIEHLVMVQGDSTLALQEWKTECK